MAEQRKLRLWRSPSADPEEDLTFAEAEYARTQQRLVIHRALWQELGEPELLIISLEPGSDTDSDRPYPPDR